MGRGAISRSTIIATTDAQCRRDAATPSARRYILLAQDQIAGTMFELAGRD